jgi:hypothetical protein
VSFSFQLPEEDPVCECKYDEAHDRMDREDCHFHCDVAEDPELADIWPAERKPPALFLGAHQEVRVRKLRSAGGRNEGSI